jgi:hypothetical protein
MGSTVSGLAPSLTGLQDIINWTDGLGRDLSARMRTSRKQLSEVITTVSSDISNRSDTMSAKTRIAVSAIAVAIAPALGSAQVTPNPNPHQQQQWAGNATLGARAAARKSSRTQQPASRGRVSQATDLSTHVIGLDGHDRGTDPDATIRFQLRRDSSGNGMGGGM